MVKLTREMVNKSPQYRNPLKDREIDLRGNKITILENLGVTKDQFDSIDLSDNDLKKLDGFPVLKHLKLLMVCNNHVSRVAQDLANFLPNLQRLVLTNNNISELADLLPITKMKSLQALTLLRNPVANNPSYRSFLIFHMPYLKYLDGQKVMPLEIYESTIKFDGIAGFKLMKELIETRTRSKIRFDQNTDNPETDQSQPHVGQRTMAIKNAIQNVKTYEEAKRLENSLKSGDVPVRK
ncbi:U2 small nuclear ribonucleoprotein A' [Thelohanellus kitauei]|uniref:U2 small nuclear ribonucleoprotein A n=1 Tax=Thelohanellus kitauei TaxID=669202 RepID=A0A0C2M361_THEKT|nr:U2 small nuclear ribonucleoprotein A' [Thelohanellus kitauei]